MVTTQVEWTYYKNVRWSTLYCKRCGICVEICPKQTLVLRQDRIWEELNCIRCGLCERYCPDLAIEVVPVEAAR